MKNILRKIPLLFFLLITLGLAAQTQDEQLAEQYFGQGEYAKALVYQRKVLDAGAPARPLLLEQYLQARLKQREFKDAARDLNRWQKKWKTYGAELAASEWILALEEENAKQSEKIKTALLKSLPADKAYIETQAAWLLKFEQPEAAREIYERGRTVLGNPNLFSAQLTEIYKLEKNYDRMVAGYVDMVEKQPQALPYVLEMMGEELNDDAVFSALRKELLRRSQAQPDNIIFPEMLSYLFLQRGDYEAAYIQIKALDKRLKENGSRMLELADKLVRDGQYEFAERVYDEVLAYGPSAPFYMMASVGKLDLGYDRAVAGMADAAKIKELAAGYREFLNKIGIAGRQGGEMTLKLADIEARFNNNTNEAINILLRYINSGVADRFSVAKAKLALGDYYIISGNMWEATLYYEQVAKAFKDDPIGHEAKFRNAKLSFYRGEFDWAKAQLDVLKSSTSELIANDAMQLSLTIQDILGMDSNAAPLLLYAEADLFIFKGMYAQALSKLDTLEARYPTHALADEALMSRAQIAVKMKDYDKALGYYEKIYTLHANDILADDALYFAARLYDRQLKNPDRAMQLYEKLILEHTGSVYGVDARTRYRQLRGDKVN